MGFYVAACLSVLVLLLLVYLIVVFLFGFVLLQLTGCDD